MCNREYLITKVKWVSREADDVEVSLGRIQNWNDLEHKVIYVHLNEIDDHLSEGQLLVFRSNVILPLCLDDALPRS